MCGDKESLEVIVFFFLNVNFILAILLHHFRTQQLNNKKEWVNMDFHFR
jgi:hypothetical protein